MESYCSMNIEIQSYKTKSSRDLLHDHVKVVNATVGYTEHITMRVDATFFPPHKKERISLLLK
jgi:hypothetical protein